MDKIKEYYRKATTWLNEEVEYTNADAVLMFVLLIGVLLK